MILWFMRIAIMRTAINCFTYPFAARRLILLRSNKQSSIIMVFVLRALAKTNRRTYASWCSLGLQKSPLVRDVFASLRQLPDVTQALEHPLETQALESLHRAYDIFDHIRPGNSEAQALLALTAEAQVVRGESPLKTLENLVGLLQHHQANDNHYKSMVCLSIAKVNWMQGDFFPAAALCRELLEDDSPAVSAAARNGHAICQLMIASTLEDLNSVLDPVRRNDTSLFPLAQLNFGAAEVIYGDVWHAKSPDSERPLDPALRQWKEGLSWFEKNTLDNEDYVGLLLRSQLNVNVAWALLQIGEVEQASEHASESLKILEDHQPYIPLTLPLTMLARCYHLSGAAVTAEGLLKTAVSTTPRTLLEKLQMRYALRTYADLCQDWEKRAGDAERLASEADNINLPEPWKKKRSYVYTSLWFWMPYEIHVF